MNAKSMNRSHPLPPSDWPIFLAAFDPQNLLTQKEAAVIQQLYQALRQAGYRPRALHHHHHYRAASDLRLGKRE
jgi:hypothetical protein